MCQWQPGTSARKGSGLCSARRSDVHRAANAAMNMTPRPQVLERTKCSNTRDDNSCVSDQIRPVLEMTFGPGGDV